MFSTFGLEFPWIGLGAAVVLVIVLFATDVLRGTITTSRWRDPAWLGWLAVAVYLLHNFEEYGTAADGVHNSFPESLCRVLGQETYPACVIPPDFYIYVNIALVWVFAPLAALLARRYVMMGFAFWGLILANAFVHIVGSISQGYNPGLVTAVVLFIPLSVWVGIVFVRHRHPKLGAGRLVIIVLVGGIAHALLVGSLLLFINGQVSVALLYTIQIFNAAFIFLVAGVALQASLRSGERPVIGD
jgi:hypothetical protein